MTSTFFFLMIRPPPRSTLFPTRRSSDLDGGKRGVEVLAADTGPGILDVTLAMRDGFSTSRSQIGRDTSELQSRRDLVCRLLLEKKKQILCRPVLRRRGRSDRRRPRDPGS